MTPPRRLALAALAIALGCDRPAPLGPTMVVEDVVRELDAGIAGASPRTLVDPGEALRGDGARTAAVMPPGGATRIRLVVPAHAALRFGVGVAGAKVRDASRTGLRFTVAVDGAPRFTRLVNPAKDRRDRRWFDERVDLAADAGRPVDVTFAVDAETPGRSLAGDAAWSRVRLVEATEVARQPEAPGRPNLLVLLVDTLRADAVGLYGGPRDATPALDAFGARGTVFATAVSQSSWTLPSVASLMTGLPPRRHRAVGDREDGAGGHARWGHLADRMTTWPELAAHAGITTFAASANPLVSRGTNVTQGFETCVELPWDAEGRNWATADEVNAAFLAWLPRRAGRRFAAYLHYMEPHDPYTPPTPPAAPAGIRPALAAGWVRDVANKVNWGQGARLSADEVRHLRERYAGEVAAWDGAFARLLAGLAAAGVLDDTVVVVTADHGEEFQEHGRLTHGSHLYEESIRVPLVVAGPGIPAGRRTDLAQTVDVLPTIARLLGTAPPARLPGRDLFAGPPVDAPAIVETSSGIAPDGRAVDVVAVRTARWKLIETPVLARTELYDLVADPGELQARATSGEVAATLAATLAAWRATPTDAAPAERVDPAFAAKLRALGYAQ